LGWAVIVMVVVLLIRWSWNLAKPMIPILLVTGVLVIAARFLIGRYRQF